MIKYLPVIIPTLFIVILLYVKYKRQEEIGGSSDFDDFDFD